jgi:hypothetical protein
VVGVFNDGDIANGAAQRLRGRAAARVNVLSGSAPVLSRDLDGLPALALMSCGRLYQQITTRLASGAHVVIVNAESSEQQLGISRVFLESKCDLLLTHDDSRPAHAD